MKPRHNPDFGPLYKQEKKKKRSENSQQLQNKTKNKALFRAAIS